MLSIENVDASGFDMRQLPLKELVLDYSSLGEKIALPATLKSLIMYKCIISCATSFAAVISSSSIESITLFDSTLPLEVAQAVGSLASVKLFNVPLSEGALEEMLCAPNLEELSVGEHSSLAVKLLAARTSRSALKHLPLQEKADCYQESDLAAIKRINPDVVFTHPK